MRLTLKDVGVPQFKWIQRGRQRVGRVVRCGAGAPGRYYGVVGKEEAYGDTEREAFDRVCAKVFGFSDPAALDAHNASVRRRKRTANLMLDALGDRFLRADVREQMSMINKLGSTPQGATVLLAAATRAIRRTR